MIRIVLALFGLVVAVPIVAWISSSMSLDDGLLHTRATQVVVATDDPRIEAEALGFGAEATTGASRLPPYSGWGGAITAPPASGLSPATKMPSSTSAGSPAKAIAIGRSSRLAMAPV